MIRQATAALALTAVSAGAAFSMSAACTAADTTTTVADYRAAFTAKTDSTWAAADGCASVPLPGGKVAWLFGDTWRKDRPAIHNSVLVQEGSRLTAPTRTQPIPNGTAGRYYWLSDGIWDGHRLRAFAGRISNVPGGFESRGMALATFRLDRRGYPIYDHRQNVTRADEDHAPMWGTAAARHRQWTYIYGQQRRQGTWLFGRDVYVARARTDRLAHLDGWRYWNGQRWVLDSHRAARIEAAESGRFASGFSVDRWRGGFVAVSKEADMFGEQILAMWSESPVGPFHIVGTLPARPSDTYWTYLARAHPEASLTNGGLLVTWNHGSNDPNLVFDTNFAKPKFGAIRDWR